MAQLVAAVSATVKRWKVDEIPDARYVKAGDEIVEVLTRYPSRGVIRVLRGAEDSTAASHDAGTELESPLMGADGALQDQILAEDGTESAKVVVQAAGGDAEALIETVADTEIATLRVEAGSENQWDRTDGADPATGATLTLLEGGVQLRAEEVGVARRVKLTPLGLQIDTESEVMLTSGTADPSAGGGVAATEGSLYLRTTGGDGQLWVKTGAADTAWTNLTP